MSHNGERSIFNIISEDGVMDSKEIIAIIKKIQKKLQDEPQGVSSNKGVLCAHSIFIDAQGQIRISHFKSPFALCEMYFPPECTASEKLFRTHHVYSLGILMLFMTTGDCNKSKLDEISDKNILKEAIQKSTSLVANQRFEDIDEMLDFISKKHNQAGKIFQFALFVLATCLVCYGVYSFYQRGRTHGQITGKKSGYESGYSLGYEKGFLDAPGIGIKESLYHEQMGNLPANISANKGAFAVRSEEELFFINRGIIYRMNPFSKKTKVLIEAPDVFHLSYHEGFLYYCTDKEIRKIHIETMREEVFCDFKTGLLHIVDGEFYLYDIGGTRYLYKIDSDTGEIRQLNDFTQYHCLNIVGGRLYYSDPEREYNLYSCDLDGKNLRLINSNHCEWFCIYNHKIVAYANSYDDYDKKRLNLSASFLLSMDLDGSNMSRLSHIPAYYVNVTEGGIFFVAGNNKTLEWMSFDGKIAYKILSTRTGPFNIAGRWIFYKNEEDGGQLWRVRIDGSDNERLE